MTQFSDIAEKISEKKKELNALKKTFFDKLKSDFAEATKFFFEETGVQAVIWNQYTPSFNDGEPCTFTLGDAIFITKGFDEEDLMAADDYEDDETFGTIPYWSWRESLHPLSEACKSFNDLLQSSAELLEDMFGNYGTTVYLTKDKTLEAEYDCGY